MTFFDRYNFPRWFHPKPIVAVAQCNHFQPTLRSGVQSAQPHIAGNTKHNSPQKQSSGRSWIIISSALLFVAIGATLAAMGIIPKIVAIGVIATVVLSGIAGAIVGGVAGYLADVVINQCHGNTVNPQCAAQ